MTTKTKRIRLASVRVPKDVLAPFVDANGWVKDGMTMKLAKARRGWLEAEAARINAEPNREAKVVGTGSYMEISVYATEEVPCTLQYRGVCQVCGGDVAVRDGTIVLHGYERPGYGYVVGNCPGTYNLPANTSIELMETRAPVLVLEKSLVADTGGPGRQRGGLGTRTRIRKLHDDGLPTLFSVYPEGVGINPPGLFGGLSGGDVHGTVTDLEGRLVHDCGTGELVTLTTTDRVVEVQLAGGAGFGNPHRRARRRLEDDIADGYVSPRSAAAHYANGSAADAAD